MNTKRFLKCMCLMLTCPLLLGTLSGCNKGKSRGLDVTVMSFNIRYENSSDTEEKHWDNRAAAVYSFLNGCDAGIVCMQEVKPSQKEDLQQNIADKYDMIWYGRDSGTTGEGLAIAFDKNVWTLVEKECFWLSGTPDVPSYGWSASIRRICVTALLEHKESGTRMKVFNTHLDHKSQSAQENGMKLILERMAECPYPTYLCGDFNCTQSGKAYQLAAEVLQDAQVTAPTSDEGSTFTGWGQKTDADKYVIDFCFFSKDNVVPQSFAICRDKWGENNQNLLSDHNPIKATVKITK